MKYDRRCESLPIKALMASCALTVGMAHAADRATMHLDAAIDRTISTVTPIKRGASPGRQQLDLRMPELRRVMAPGAVLSADGWKPDELDQSVEIIAAPALVAMSSDAQAPLGLIASLQWSLDHPTQAWRILLPSTLAP